MGGKLTKFCGHEVITKNHESFIPENFLPYGILVTIVKIISSILVGNSTKATMVDSQDLLKSALLATC